MRMIFPSLDEKAEQQILKHQSYNAIGDGKELNDSSRLQDSCQHIGLPVRLHAPTREMMSTNKSSNY